MNEEKESKSWIEKIRDREIGTELKENVWEGIKFGANWVGTKALELLPEEEQQWWHEKGWPHLQSEWEYATNRSRNMTGPLNMTGPDAFALLTSPSWVPYAVKGEILSHITRIDPDLTTIFGAGLRPKHLGISQKVTPYNPLQLKGSKPVDFKTGSSIINEIFDRPKFNQNIVKGPFANWQSQNVPFGQTSPNITKEVYDAALQTNAQGSGSIHPMPESTILKDSTGKVVRNRVLAKGTRQAHAIMSSINIPQQGTSTMFDRQVAAMRKVMEEDVPPLADVKTPGHHGAPVKTIGTAIDYLTDEGIVIGLNYLQEKIGHPLGDFQTGHPVETMLHRKLHAYLDSRLGTSRSLLKKLEAKYFGNRRLSDGISVQERIESGFYNELAEVIVTHEGFIDDFQRALVDTYNSKDLKIEKYVEHAWNLAQLDKEFQAITSGKTGRMTGTQLIANIIGETNQRLVKATAEVNSLPKDSPLLSVERSNLISLLMYDQGVEILKEIFPIMQLGLSEKDAAQRIFQLFDSYGLWPDQPTDWDLINALVDDLEKLNIEDVLKPEHYQVIKDWK